jgi:hypothetical protein
MKQRIGLATAWLVATALAVGVASQAVDLVGDRAEEVPVAVPVVGTVRSAPTVTASPLTPVDTTVTSVPVIPSTTTPPSTAAPSTGATTTPQSTTTTVSPSTTTTSIVSSTTTTSLSPLESGTVFTPGGQVSAACTGAETITLQGAVPASGWTVDVEESGPERVRVEFEQGEQEHKVTVRCGEGRLVSETQGS